MMLTRGSLPAVDGRRSHSGRATSAMRGMPIAASTMRENHASATMLPAIQWTICQLMPLLYSLWSVDSALGEKSTS